MIRLLFNWRSGLALIAIAIVGGTVIYSRMLAKKIEQELTYPGQIRVTVIRESRYVEYAK